MLRARKCLFVHVSLLLVSLAWNAGAHQEVHHMAQNGQPRHVSWLTQFIALLHKNVLLLAASRGSPLKRFSGWGSLLFRLAVPALFFTIMLLPKYYIPVRM